MLKLLILAIFLIPISSILQMQGTIVWYPQVIALLALGFLVASFYIWKVSKPLAVISAYSAYSYIFICHQHPRAMLLLMICYAGLGLMCAAAQIKETKKMYHALIGMACFQFAFVLLQKLNLDPIFHSIANDRLSEAVGFVGSHNQLGIYYAAITPILFHFCMPLALIAIAAIVISSCSSAAIGAFAGLCFYIYTMKLRYMFWFIIPVALIGLVLMQRYDGLTGVFAERAKLWNQTISQAVKGKVVMDMSRGVHKIQTFSPLTGAGIGNFMMLSPSSQGDSLFGTGWNHELTPRWEHAHNDLIEYFFEFGWLGLALLGWLIIDLVLRFSRAVKTNMLVVTFSALIALAVTSLGVYVIHAPVSYFMLCLILGLFYAEEMPVDKDIDPWLNPGHRLVEIRDCSSVC